MRPYSELPIFKLAPYERLYTNKHENNPFTLGGETPPLLLHSFTPSLLHSFTPSFLPSITPYFLARPPTRKSHTQAVNR